MELVNHMALGIAWIVGTKGGGGTTNSLRKRRVRKVWKAEKCGSGDSAMIHVEHIDRKCQIHL